MRKSIVEEWRDIPKYCGLYQASNLGYIRSVTRVTIQSGAQRCIKGRTLSPAKDKFGYSRVTLSKSCKKHQIIKGVKTTRIQAYGYKWRYK